MNRAESAAFPRPASSDVQGRHIAMEGATLREYLTGQALVGVMAINAGRNPDHELVARHAVALADLALIALSASSHEEFVEERDAAAVDLSIVSAGMSLGPLPEEKQPEAPRSVEQVRGRRREGRGGEGGDRARGRREGRRREGRGGEDL